VVFKDGHEESKITIRAIAEMQGQTDFTHILKAPVYQVEVYGSKTKLTWPDPQYKLAISWFSFWLNNQ
jgi:hypothetical protein